MNRIISFIIMLLPSIAQASDVPQIIREKVKEQLAYTECSNLKLDDWKIYPNQPIDDSKLLYHRMVDGNDIIVLDIGAAQKDDENCYLGGSCLLYTSTLTCLTQTRLHQRCRPGGVSGWPAGPHAPRG